MTAMQRIEKSGYHHSILLMSAILTALDDIIGAKGLSAVLKYANMDEYINNYPLPNRNEGSDFADMSSLFQAVEEIYGMRGSRVLLTRAGRKGLDAYREKLGSMMTFLELEVRLLPHGKRIKHSIDFLMKLLAKTGNQHFTLLDQDDELIYQITNCSACYGRPRTDHSVCYMTVGAMQGIINWVTGGEDHQVVENLCIAKGDPYCEFHISCKPFISTKEN